MAVKRKEIGVKISGLDSEAAWKHFREQTAAFWAKSIENQLNKLSIPYEEKVIICNKVLDNIKNRRKFESDIVAK